MKTIIGKTFVFFVISFMIVHLLFSVPTFIKYLSLSHLLFSFFIVGLLSSLFALVTVLLTMAPLQFLRQHFSIKPLTFYGLYFATIILVTTCILLVVGEMNTRVDGMKLYLNGLDVYKSLGTFYQIEVMINYVVVLTTAIYLDRKIKQRTSNGRLTK